LDYGLAKSSAPPPPCVNQEPGLAGNSARLIDPQFLRIPLRPGFIVFHWLALLNRFLSPSQGWFVFDSNVLRFIGWPRVYLSYFHAFALRNCSFGSIQSKLGGPL